MLVTLPLLDYKVLFKNKKINTLKYNAPKTQLFSLQQNKEGYYKVLIQDDAQNGLTVFRSGFLLVRNGN